MSETTLLAEDDVRDLIAMSDVVEGVERTYEEMGEGRVVNPAKLGLDLGESGGWPHFNSFMNAMPAYVDWLDTAGLKWAGGFWDNVDRGLAPISALILLIDPRRGNFRAVMEGAHITALRTGAQTAVGAKYLAPEATSVGIFGAGTQARYNARAIDRVLDVERLTVFDVREDAMQEYVEDMSGELDATVRAADDGPDAAGSDLVVTVTTAKEPFVEADWLGDDTTVAALGSYQELHDDAIRGMDAIVVDHVEQCLHRGALKDLAEAGELTADEIDATIGDVVSGSAAAASGRTLFVPIGIGALDITVAGQVYERAKERGFGDSFEFVSDDE